MTELEIWKLVAQPAIFALAMLSFLKASWRVRLLSAVGAAVVGLAIGLVTMWTERSGAPWLGWAIAAPLAMVVLWRWLQRRRAAAHNG